MIELKRAYKCENCGVVFESLDDCLEHEKTCGLHICSKCGKREKIKLKDVNSYVKLARWHKIDLGYGNYGSQFDGEEIKFELCDECLAKNLN